MIELLNSLEKHAEKHLMLIEEELETHGKFTCPQQIDDLCDLLCSIKSIEKLKAMPLIK